MFYVYILRSEKTKNKFYIGITTNVEKRLKQHLNPSFDKFTYRYSPWNLETYIVFRNKLLAEQFEVYLKTSSGRTFIKRHLVEVHDEMKL